VSQALATTGAALSLFLLLVLAVKRPFRLPDSWLAVWFFAQCVFSVGVLLGLAAPSRKFVTGPAYYLYAASAPGASRHPRWHAATASAVAVLVFAFPLVVPVRAEVGAMVADLTTPWC
jgi:hypothetical protein